MRTATNPQSSILHPQSFFGAGGFPTTGFARGALVVAAEAGSRSFGSERESENAPLAERCFPTFGLRIASS